MSILWLGDHNPPQRILRTPSERHIVKSMGQPITILVQGKDGGIPVERLLDVLTRAHDVLRHLDAKNSEDGKAGIHWHVTKATTNSPLTLTLSPHVAPTRRDNSRQVGSAFVRGLKKMESGKGVPSDFSDETLRDVRALLGLLDRGVTRMEFSLPGDDVVVPTLRSAALIDEYFGRRSTYHLADTTIEGSLETVTVHGGEAFDVFDQLTGTRVRCVLPVGQLQTAVAALGKRVAIAGRAKFNEKGRPVAIEVESIRVMLEKSMIPKASDFEGDGSLDITGGIESAEFVRRIRDA